ncbi:phosphoglucosamine mutase [Kiritimatiella glycovorans]|uniref:Phosphoglucosamine mutase n=1 Tax=Kiritimatiella glycovorans TaxID=1307763 RepID=A0A0G3EC04_9BACT|nr:phosphoglucosamine mutase [Kiritimatiella glycovorans]AKJ63803.1 Phosphoglucosamine mutase [Kiritimatiella glycovorans]
MKNSDPERFTLKVGISGVRGIVGRTITPQLAVSFAQAFGVFAGAGPVVVARDTRTSGRMLEEAVFAGLQSVGCRPLLCGVIPTPSALFLVRRLGARGGIVITASHNPAEWNALKFVDRNGFFLNRSRSGELFDLYHQRDFPMVSEAELPAARKIDHAAAAHLDAVAAYVDTGLIRSAGFKIAVDPCNGTGALYTRPFLERLGCEVVELHAEPNGVFGRDPEPAPAHVRALCDLVRKERCDAGFAQDPDGDRLSIVDEHGSPAGENLSVAFAVRRVLEAHASGPVVVNLSTSRCIDDLAREYGVAVHRSRIGEINVVEAMLRHGAAVGGEHNGGVIVPAVHPCRDSFIGMALALELMAAEQKSVSKLKAEIPAYHTATAKLETPAGSTPSLLRALRRHYADHPVDTSDGVFVSLPRGWLHVRRSNTEPVIRFTAEAGSADEARNLVDTALNLTRAHLQG